MSAFPFHVYMFRVDVILKQNKSFEREKTFFFLLFFHFKFRRENFLKLHLLLRLIFFLFSVPLRAPPFRLVDDARRSFKAHQLSQHVSNGGSLSTIREISRRSGYV